MIRNIIASILVAFPAIALAQERWVEVRPGTFMNKPTLTEGVYLAASMDTSGDVAHFFISYENFFCAPGENAVVGYLGDFRVNEQPLHFELECKGGVELYYPQTDEGKQFLDLEIQREYYVEIEFGHGRTYEYDVFGYSTVEGIIYETNANAM